MNPKINQPWIPLDRIESIVQLEPALFIFSLAVIAWVIYKVFLREAFPHRHRSLRSNFLNLLAHLAIFGALFAGYAVSHNGFIAGEESGRLASYLGLAAMISGAIVFVKASRILLLEYLYLGHMREGVPLLIVNLFTLIISMGLVGWFATDIFGVRLAPLLATSAIFSLVLGLALQDTLGNLFAGVALQLDKPYEIGDWIEVVPISGSASKQVGQVHEITWRATTLIGIFEELIVIPNRGIAQSEIMNYSAQNKPIWRVQSIRIPYGADIPHVRKLILDAMKKVEGVRQDPSPVVNILETTESWLHFRCGYAIDDYGSQWRMGTAVITSIVETLHAHGLPLAATRLQVITPTANPGASV